MCAVRRVTRRSLLAAALAVGTAPSLALASRGSVRSTPAGRYRGASIDGVTRYLGIRYGTAPRLLAPQPLPPHAGTLDALQFAAAAPQSGDAYTPQSEDCLALNIWVPDAATTAPRPVMVYFHGGAYSNGSVTDALNDGARLAHAGNVVVVTVNHRLNALGYLYLARLDARYPDSGNLGQLDLILALRWIRENIAAFSGDPQCVTVFGQSGGGAKIATLMAMPAAAGLFHRAITMSGQQVTASGPLNATRRAETYLQALGKDPANAGVAELIAALRATDPVLGGGLYFGPVLDNRNLPRHPFYPDAAPQSLAIPLMLGNTIRETRAFFPPGHPRLAGLDWSNLAARLGPELRVDIQPEIVVAAYRQWFPSYSPVEIFHAATTAGRSWRGQLIEAELRAAAGAPAFVYQLDFENAGHTDDIGLAFGTTADASTARAAMSRELMQRFLHFARSGDPGWPAYDLKDRQTMLFDTVSRVASNPRARERELFAAVPYIQPGS